MAANAETGGDKSGRVTLLPDFRSNISSHSAEELCQVTLVSFGLSGHLLCLHYSLCLAQVMQNAAQTSATPHEFLFLLSSPFNDCNNSLYLAFRFIGIVALLCYFLPKPNARPLCSLLISSSDLDALIDILRVH